MNLLGEENQQGVLAEMPEATFGDFFGVGAQGRHLTSNGMSSPQAMAWAQALGNIARMNMGFQPGVNPAAAADNARMQNQRLMQMKANNIEAARYRQMRMALEAAKLDQKPKLSAYMEKRNDVLRSLGQDPENFDYTILNSPQYAEAFDRIGGGQDINVGGTVVQNMPSVPEMAGVDSKAAKDDFRANLEGMSELLSIGSNMNPEYLTRMGKINQWYLGQKDKLGQVDPASEDGQSLAEYTQFQNQVKQYFNNYRRLVTGAAGSEQELKGLEESIFNLNQGPVAFQASLNNLTATMARDIRGAIYLAATGAAQMGTKGMGEALERRSAAKFLSDDHFNTVSEYIAESLGFTEDTATPEQIIYLEQQLHALGFPGMLDDRKE